jgi:hypothetical protein
MTINQNIAYTKVLPSQTTAIAFNPSTISIAIGQRLIGKGAPVNGQPTDLLQIGITLNEVLKDASGNEIGYNRQYKDLIVPAAYMDSCIAGYDTVKNEPKLDMAALSNVLAAFDLKLV